MRAVDLIERKKRGLRHTRDEVEFLVGGFARGEVPDYQMAAWMMAVAFRGLDDRETAWLVETMRDSGDTLDLEGIEGPTVDKHSTGGVGDKTTLALAPLVAACGLKVAKMTGRGLGHTGGTMDKLESIPGFRSTLTPEEFRRCVNRIGMAVSGQSANLVPADKKMYALRDVTATVDPISLITGSIMSKKLAVANDALVLDVKVGSGAFMKTPEAAEALARMMVATGRRLGRKVRALVTDMNQPLGLAIGNALEVAEAMETLQGGGPADFRELVLTLASHLVSMVGKPSDLRAARKLAEEKIASGEAWGKFRDFVAAQGGDVASLGRLPIARTPFDLPSPRAGFVRAMDTEAIGIAAMKLGAGRATKDDVIDLAVGMRMRKKIGDRVVKGEALMTLYYNDRARLDAALEQLQGVIDVGRGPVVAPKVVLKVIR